MSQEALRLKNYRAFNSLIKNIKKLREYKEITAKEMDWLIAKTTSLYEKLKAEFRARNRGKHKKRGRPRNLRRDEIYKTCKKVGCNNKAARDQVYCCRDHAPLAHFLDGNEYT